ncbi:AAA family ATPase [Sulfurovum sp. ST-21]|uniref:AAA family ATPase n=1 Tax=Sulfurovum indicum TaxID=2779528 RepID=A0A7M1S2I3_9BACT|nr:AAA family ATPase [Sulfurovum indicum]QOR61231.1 AAA family ATPase [Sulfurovum indicum]
MSLHNDKIKKSDTKWMNAFENTVWSKLKRKQKRKLCKRFGLLYMKDTTLDMLTEQIEVPALPLAFCIAAMHKLKQWDVKLLQSNPYKQLWIEKLTYDQDRWGIRRTHTHTYGIYENTPLSYEQQHYLEQLLKSSVSLDKSNKIDVLTSTETLSEFQLSMLIETFESEMNTFALQYMSDSDKNIKKLVQKAEEEWLEIEQNLSYYVSGKNHPEIILDKQKNLVPRSIRSHIEKTIKGQEDAVKKIASLLYYQQKIYRSHTHKKKIPFEPLDPVLISGSTGSGKSFLLEVSCNMTGLPYIHADCSTLVSEGIRGYTLNDMLKDLLRKTHYRQKEAEAAVVIFDEVDKLLTHHDGQAILYQLLRIVEGADVSISKSYGEEKEFSKISTISTRKMLFFFAGSFQGVIEEKKNRTGFIRPVDSTTEKPLQSNEIEKTELPKELLGRINDIIILNRLSREDYREILLESKHSPLKKYQKMLLLNDRHLELSPEQIEEILDQAEQSPYGARSLNKIIKNYFEKALYEAPDPQ